MKIQINKKAPDFKLASTSNKIFKLSGIKSGVVMYFYPKDNTPGCTLETKDFSKLYSKFKSAKYEVVGISKDVPTKPSMFDILNLKDKINSDFQNNDEVKGGLSVLPNDAGMCIRILGNSSEEIRTTIYNIAKIVRCQVLV